MNAVINLIQSYSLFFLLGIGTIFTFYWLMRFRDKLNLHWYTAILISILHTVWGVFCVSVFAFAESGFSSDAVGNMSLFGGVFFMPLFYWGIAKILRLKSKVVFDLCTNCMLFTLMCARINCIIAGCCKGTFVFHTCYRWPTRELEIVFYVVLILVFSYKLKTSETNGIIYPIYMMSYGIFRFIVEFFRVGDGNLLIHPAHIWALISLCIGFSIYAEIKNKEKKGRRSKND